MSEGTVYRLRPDTLSQEEPTGAQETRCER